MHRRKIAIHQASPRLCCVLGCARSVSISSSTPRGHHRCCSADPTDVAEGHGRAESRRTVEKWECESLGRVELLGPFVRLPRSGYVYNIIVSSVRTCFEDDP